MNSIIAKTLMFACLIAGSACGTSVKSIDLHDPNVPVEARRYVADAQDTVSIARARRDDAKLTLEFTQNWRDEVTDDDMWPKGSSDVLKSLYAFTNSRVDMAELEYERAEAKLDLAEAKYTLATAETAMRNDLAVYDLKPLKADTEKIRNEIESVAGEIETQRVKVDKLTMAWWKTYASFSKSGKVSRAFYVSSKLAAQLREREVRMKAQRKETADEKQADKDEKDGKAKKADAKKAKTKKPAEESEAVTEDDKIDLDL